MKQSERGRVARMAGLSEAELKRQFDTPTEMTVFSYEGPIDTVMTPMDSMLYTKSFLRAGFMSMEPTTGFVKAYVGVPISISSSMIWYRQAAARLVRLSSHSFILMPLKPMSSRLALNFSTKQPTPLRRKWPYMAAAQLASARVGENGRLWC